MINFVPLKWRHYARLKLERAQALKLFVWFLALLPVAGLNFREFRHILALLVALTCLLSPFLREAFIGSIRHHIKTFQGRFIIVVFLCFLPSIIFSAWPGVGVVELVPFILTLLLLTGLAGIIPLMDDSHRRLLLEIMIWGFFISLFVFFLLHHPSYHKLPVQEGYWGILQGIYNLNHLFWFTKSETRYLALFFPIFLFAFWHRRPRRPFLIFLFLFLTILLLYLADSRTTIAGLFANMCILAMGIFFLLSLSSKQKKYGLLLFLLAIMIPAPIVIERGIKNQKQYLKREINVRQVAKTPPTPLGLPVSVIDIERQIIWREYIRSWSEKPFLGYGIGGTRHHKKTPLRINNRLNILLNSFVKKRQNPHPKNISHRDYYHHNYIYELLMKKGFISPQDLKITRINNPNSGVPVPFQQYHPHNYYVQILFEAGLIGFIPFMAFLFFFFGRSVVIFWRSREVGALFIFGLHGMFFTEGFFAPRFFIPIDLIMYGTAWMVILVLTRQPDRIEQNRPV